jgi:hypothetical protein
MRHVALAGDAEVFFCLSVDVEAHIWTRPGLQDLADGILGKDCEHISGLEVEGRRPRALMESALLLPNRSSASKAQPRLGLEEAGLTSYATNAFILQSQGKIYAATR